MKVIVGMSGGVDSSVAAWLLREEGLEVEGVSFRLYEARLKGTFAGCCSLESIKDAARTAERIGIPHTMIDLRDEFLSEVIEPFIDAYARGITPNPCILCNRRIKFPHLLRIADELGAEWISTGHYARVAPDTAFPGRQVMNGLLLKGMDSGKDQSYVLYGLRPEELRRLRLPLGGMTKAGVREIARRLDLPAANRPESQEICFVEDGDYTHFVGDVAGKGEGPVIDIESGSVLGTHRGIHLYTIGQRKRINVNAGRPLYVARIDRQKNAVYVGPKEKAMAAQVCVAEINWLVDEIERQHMVPGEPFRATVKIRSMMQDEPAVITVSGGDRAVVVFDEPQWAPAPGQAAVFYDGDTVLGGGTIE